MRGVGGSVGDGGDDVERQQHAVAGQVVDADEGAGALPVAEELAAHLHDGRMATDVGDEGDQLDDVAEVAAERAGARGRTALRLSHFTGLTAVVERTDCLAVLPRFLAETLEETAGIRVFPHPVEVATMQLAVYARDPGHQRPAQRWFAKFLVGTLRETMSPDPSAPLRPGPLHRRRL